MKIPNYSAEHNKRAYAKPASPGRRIYYFLWVLKISAIVALFRMDPSFSPAVWIDFIKNFIAQQRYIIAGILLSVDLICIGAIIVTPFLQNVWVRLPFAIFIVAFTGFGALYHWITNEQLNYMSLNILLRNLPDARNAGAAFIGNILPAIAIFLPIAVIISFLPKKYPIRLPLPFVAFPVLGSVLVSGLFYNTGTLPGYPSYFKILGDMSILAITRPYSAPRRAVDYTGKVNPLVKYIVYIVDESVRGDFLEINNHEEATTPYLETMGKNLFNFGTASSITNCSEATRLALRSGLRRDQIPDYDYQSLKQPSIWQFAKRAGFKTVYIDGFRETGAYHSYMNEYEITAIDKQFHLGKIKPEAVDLKIARLIRKELAGNEPVFIFAEKRGIHFPYYRNYPEKNIVFPFDKTAAYIDADRDALRNDYRNGIRWSVDYFFQKLLTGINLSNVFIIYTSDHGQNLLDDGKMATHCRRTATTVPEAVVPLFAITSQATLSTRLNQAVKDHYNRLSHFNIFPTILDVMGYDNNWIRSEKGLALWGGGNIGRQFYVGILFGRPKPGRWIRFERDN